MTWSGNLSAEIVETFSMLVVPSYAGFSTFERSGRATAAEKRAEARRVKLRARERERYAERAAAPLEPIERDGVIWMVPNARVERKRAYARAYARERRAERKSAA